ncbi:MAG: HPr family phosphocarrier protein [Candidatus Omnitrophica bacterium]|nr:HPr family phosphocarrier protein [Candidatus Omnitrophota bacterium]
MPKIEKDIVIVSPQGLHARPAAIFVQIAMKYSSNITVKKDREVVNGKSIMGILMLGAHQNSKITITADGDDANEMIKELEEFLSRDERDSS